MSSGGREARCATLDSPTTPVFHYRVHFERTAQQHHSGTMVGTCSNGASGC